MWGILSLALYVGALAVAAASDLIRYQIPNLASLTLITAFALVIPSISASALAAHAAAGLAVFGVAAIGFAAGICGGGDVKLLGATALWAGWNHLAALLLLTTIAGAVLALLLIAARRATARRPELRSGRWYSRLLSENEGVPYGVAIAFAGIAVLSQLDIAALPSPNSF